MKTYQLIINADYNDGDNINNTEIVSEEELPRIKSIINTLKKTGHNWETNNGFKSVPPEQMYKGIISEEDIEYFADLVPNGEYGIHTIETIELIEVSNIEVLFNGRS